MVYGLSVTFSKDEAINIATDDRLHQSAHDRKRSVHSVEGYELDVVEGETAKEALDIYLDCGDFKDPDYYMEINVG